MLVLRPAVEKVSNVSDILLEVNHLKTYFFLDEGCRRR